MVKGTPRLDRSTTCHGDRDSLGMIMIIQIIVMMVKKMMKRRNEYDD